MLRHQVRKGCLELLRSIASIEDVQSEMGSMGAIPIMLSFVADAEVHPLNIRQSAVSILSQLCREHGDNKVALAPVQTLLIFGFDSLFRSYLTVSMACLS